MVHKEDILGKLSNWILLFDITKMSSLQYKKDLAGH